MSRLDSYLNKTEIKQREHLHDISRIYLAEIMDARDPLKTGELMVWIVNSGTDRNKRENWVLAKSANSVYGLSVVKTTNCYDYTTSPTSFGWWNPIPYIGNYVFIFFPCVMGENSSPYWFGTPMQKNNEMIPGVPYNLSQNSDYSAKCEVNYKDSADSQTTSVFFPLQTALERQGLDKDRLRGISTSSSFRDTPSHCYGFLSPLGNQMVIDDGWSLGDSNISWVNNPRMHSNDNDDKDDYGLYHSKKNWIASIDESEKDNKLNRFHGGFRFRTRNGTQLLILDAGNIYMINKDGTAWAELSEDGYIDCYSKKGVNAASDGDINLHAIYVNIEAIKKVSIKAGAGISMETSGNVMVKSGSLNVSDRVSVPYIVADEGQIGVFKSPDAELTGTFAGTLQGTAYYATAAGYQPIEQKYPDITPKTSDSVTVTETVAVKQKVDEEEIYTITTRVPTHEPWAGHDKNNNIPSLEVKQTMKKEEKNVVNNTVTSNQVRR